MTTIADIKNDIARAEGIIADAKKKLEKMENPAPCPLELGEEVIVRTDKTAVKQWVDEHLRNDGTIRVSVVPATGLTKERGREKEIVIRTGWWDTLPHARALIEACGNKED